MNSETMSWGERLLAASATLLAMLWTYWTFLRRSAPTRIKESSATQIDERINQRIIEKQTEIAREDFVQEKKEDLSDLLEEVKENSKDAESAAKALENSQL